jgi:hypothetical protein
MILACAYSAVGAAMGLKIIGVIYALVAIVGLFTSGDMLLGIMRVNAADHWLHVLLAIVILAARFLLPDEEPAMA